MKQEVGLASGFVSASPHSRATQGLQELPITAAGIPVPSVTNEEIAAVIPMFWLAATEGFAMPNETPVAIAEIGPKIAAVAALATVSVKQGVVSAPGFVSASVHSRPVHGVQGAPVIPVAADIAKVAIPLTRAVKAVPMRVRLAGACPSNGIDDPDAAPPLRTNDPISTVCILLLLFVCIVIKNHSNYTTLFVTSK